MELKGKTALVTGASRGIGRAVAFELAARGAQVAVHYRKEKGAAEETLAQLCGEGHAVIRADAGDPSAALELIDGTVRAVGGLDILVNNAGVWVEHKLAEVSFDEWKDAWDRTLAVNLLGPAHIMYWAARHMIKHGGGRIINISSRGAFRGEPDGPAYGASKAGLNSLSQSMAKALAPHNIYVHVVAPGFIKTDMAAPFIAAQGDELRNQSPLGRVGRPEEVAAAVALLASERADYMTGGIVDVNGASYLRS